MLKRNVTLNMGWTEQRAGLQVQYLHLASHFELLQAPSLQHIESEADRQRAVVNHFLCD